MNLLAFIAAVLLATVVGLTCWKLGEVLVWLTAWCLGVGRVG